MNTQLAPGAMVTGTVPQVVVCLKSPEVVIAVTISGSVPLLTRVIVSGELGVLRTTWPKSRLLITVPPSRNWAPGPVASAVSGNCWVPASSVTTRLAA